MLAQDLRFALRSLLKTPSFTVIAVLTLAIGIGANIGVFSLANAFLLRPYPYAEPKQLIWLRSLDLNSGTASNMSSPDYVDLARGSQLIGGFAAVDREPYNLGGAAEAVYVQGAQVTATLFDVLGTRPLFGRTFLPDDDLPGADNVVILSETLWRNNFAADNKIVSSTVTIDAEPYTVIGVIPSGGGYPDEASLWVTLRLDPEAHQARPPLGRHHRPAHPRSHHRASSGRSIDARGDPRPRVSRFQHRGRRAPRRAVRIAYR